MKILFIDTEPIRRGAQIFISELSSFLGDKGEHTKIIYLYQHTNDSEDAVSFSPGTVVLTGDKHSTFEKFPGINPTLVRELLKEINGFCPDVILSNGSRTLKYAALARQLYTGEAKWIARWIDDAVFWNPGITSKLIYSKLIMSQFDGCIGVSHASLDSMIRHYGFKKTSQVIHRVFDPKKFGQAPSRAEARRTLGLKETDEVLLFLGNLTAQKRPDRFIEIVNKLSENRPHLKALIVGDGVLREELEKQILSPDSYREKYQVKSIKYQVSRDKDHEISGEDPSVCRLRSSNNQQPTSNILPPTSNFQPPTSNLFFHGYQQDVSPYLAAADILVLTSDTEGLPGVVLEAAHFSVPTVASEVGGIKECLINGKTGLLVADRSVEVFCGKITVLLEDPNLKNQMGLAAKDFVTQNFRMDQVAEQYLHFFQQVINET